MRNRKPLRESNNQLYVLGRCFFYTATCTTESPKQHTRKAPVHVHWLQARQVLGYTREAFKHIDLVFDELRQSVYISLYRFVLFDTFSVLLASQKLLEISLL